MNEETLIIKYLHVFSLCMCVCVCVCVSMHGHYMRMWEFITMYKDNNDSEWPHQVYSAAIIETF